MERDFMGLGSGKDVSSDSAPARGLGMHWSFPNKVSAIPHFLSYKAAQDDMPRRSVCDYPLVSSGLMPMSNADAIESNQKPHTGVVQKNLNLENQMGSQFVVTGYPLQHLDALSVRRVHEAGKFLTSNQPNQSISIAYSKPVLQSQIALTGPGMGSSAVKQQPLGGVPVVASCSFIGTTDQRNASKHRGPAAQLTIFYAGSVNVFDGISPERAQAITMLARNGHPITPNTKPTGSALPTLSHAGSQPGGGGGSSTSSSDELMAGKTKAEPAKVVTSLGSTTPPYIPAVPQARKASLARFLEKRKERMMNASPYNCSMKSRDSSTPAYTFLVSP